MPPRGVRIGVVSYPFENPWRETLIFVYPWEKIAAALKAFEGTVPLFTGGMPFACLLLSLVSRNKVHWKEYNTIKKKQSLLVVQRNEEKPN